MLLLQPSMLPQLLLSTRLATKSTTTSSTMLLLSVPSLELSLWPLLLLKLPLLLKPLLLRRPELMNQTTKITIRRNLSCQIFLLNEVAFDCFDQI